MTTDKDAVQQVVEEELQRLRQCAMRKTIELKHLRALQDAAQAELDAIQTKATELECFLASRKEAVA